MKFALAVGLIACTVPATWAAESDRTCTLDCLVDCLDDDSVMDTVVQKTDSVIFSGCSQWRCNCARETADLLSGFVSKVSEKVLHLHERNLLHANGDYLQ